MIQSNAGGDSQFYSDVPEVGRHAVCGIPPEEIKNAKAKALKPPTRGSEELAATIAILLLIETKGEYPFEFINI